MAKTHMNAKDWYAVLPWPWCCWPQKKVRDFLLAFGNATQFIQKAAVIGRREVGHASVQIHIYLTQECPSNFSQDWHQNPFHSAYVFSLPHAVPLNLSHWERILQTGAPWQQWGVLLSPTAAGAVSGCNTPSFPFTQALLLLPVWILGDPELEISMSGVQGSWYFPS